jgi:uncharacterized protein YggE
MRQVEKVAEVIDAAVGAGANGMADVRFSVTEARMEELREKAREEAIKVARRKAEQISRLLDFQLGKPVAVSESEPYVQYAYSKVSALTGDGGILGGGGISKGAGGSAGSSVRGFQN